MVIFVFEFAEVCLKTKSCNACNTCNVLILSRKTKIYSSFQLSVESNFAFSLVLHYYAL